MDALHSLKLHDYWNLIIRMFSIITEHSVGRGSDPSAEKQTVYSTATADWATEEMNDRHRWREKVNQGNPYNQNDLMYIYIYIYTCKLYVQLFLNN